MQKLKHGFAMCSLSPGWETFFSALSVKVSDVILCMKCLTYFLIWFWMCLNYIIWMASF